MIIFLTREVFNHQKLLLGLFPWKPRFYHIIISQFIRPRNATNFSFALGNIPGGSQTEQITLPKDVPDWSIWHPNYKNAGMRQKEKCDEGIRKKSSCGAFMVAAAACCLV